MESEGGFVELKSKPKHQRDATTKLSLAYLHFGPLYYEVSHISP